MRRTSWLLAVALLPLSMACGAADEAPDSEESLSEAASIRPATYQIDGCAISTVLQDVPQKRLRNRVPSEFDLQPAFERATDGVVVIQSMRCRTVTDSAGSSRTSTFSRVGIAINSVDGTGDMDVYSLWHLTNNPALADDLARFGVTGERTSDLSFSASGGAVNASADFEGGDEDYSVSHPFVEPPADTFSGNINFWERTGKGLVKMPINMTSLRFSEAFSGTIKSDGGTDLSAMMGGTNAAIEYVQFMRASGSLSVLKVAQ